MKSVRGMIRKMGQAALALTACSLLVPSLFAQAGTQAPVSGRAKKPSAIENRLRSPLPAGKGLAKFGDVPMYFEENLGQTDSRVKFLTRGRGYSLFLTEDEAVLALKRGQGKAGDPPVLRMRLSGGRPAAGITGEEPLLGKIYYGSQKAVGPLKGNATYGRVKYAQVYPGIDLVYYGKEKQLEFDFVVAPHSDPGRIRLTFSGAEKITVAKDGELALRVSGEEIRLKKPLIYQERNGARTEIAGGYVLSDRAKSEVSFRLAAYDPSLPLVIDPQIDFATYLGGTGNDFITDVRVAPTGEIYLLGSTEPSTGFPTTQTIPPQGLYASDCFVSKLSADGSTLLYSVIFPGTFGVSMAVDLFGKVHLSLFEWGVASFQRTLTENSNGTLSVTLLQGAFNFHQASADKMQVDAQGNVYMIFEYYPINSTQVEYGLFKVDSSGQLVGKFTLLVPTLVPQPSGTSFQEDNITGLAVDDAGHAFVIGNAWSAGRITPTANAFQSTQGDVCPPSSSATNCGDGFVLEIDTNTPNSFAITYASYLGGSQREYLTDLALGFDGVLYMAGQTASVDFPLTPGPYSTPLPSYCAVSACSVGFIVKLDPSKPPSQQLVIGAVLIGASLGGGAITALPGGLPALLSSQSAYFVGVNPLYNLTQGPSIAVLSANGSSVVFLSYLEPDATYVNSSWTSKMTSNGSGRLYVGGHTQDPRLGTPGAYQQNLAGGTDVLIRAISGIATNNPPTVDLGPAVTLPATDQNGALFALDCTTLPCTISDPDNDPLISYRWVGPNGFTAMSSSAPPVSSVQLPLGSNKLSLIVRDNQGAVGVGTLIVNVTDTDPPVVSPSGDQAVTATQPAGASGSASPALHNFLFASATAQDLVDPHPVALPPQVDWGGGPVDVDDLTLFPVGPTVVTFRFADSSGNIGSAVATLTVHPFGQQTSADLQLSIAPSLGTVVVGQPVTVTAYVANIGPDPASQVTFQGFGYLVDQFLYNELSAFSVTSSQGSCQQNFTNGVPMMCSLRTIQPGGIATITVNLTPAASIVAYGSVYLQTDGTVNAQESDPSTGNNSYSTGFVVSSGLSADLSVAVSVPLADVPVGQPATITAVVTNHGPDPATNVTWDSQIALAGFTNFSLIASQGSCTGSVGTPLQCSLGTLAPGASASVTIMATPTIASFPNPSFLTLSIGTPMQVSASETDPNGSNNATTAAFNIRQPSPLSADVSVSASVPAAAIAVGQVATITAVVTNHGPDPATNVTWDSQIALAGFTGFGLSATQGSCTGSVGTPLQCLLGTLASGASATITIVATPTAASFPNPSFLTLSVGTPMQVTASEADPIATNNNATATFSIRQLSADVGVTVSVPPTSVSTGQPATITAVVANHGPDPATNVTWDSQIALAGFTGFSLTATQGSCTGSVGTPLQCLLGTLASGASATITIVATPTAASFPNPSFLTLSVGTPMQVTASEADPIATNNNATATFSIRQLSADVAVAVMVPPTNVVIGQPVTVTAMVINNGPDAASNVAFSGLTNFTNWFNNLSATTTNGNCTLPAVAGNPIQCSLGAMASGASATITVNAITTAAPFAGTSLPTVSVGASVQVSATEPDPTPNNNQAYNAFNLAQPVGASTPTGTNVTVQPTNSNGVAQPVTVTFPRITQAGVTIANGMMSPPPAPTGFLLKGVTYDIVTTAQYAPPPPAIVICFGGSYSASDLLYHYQNGVWVVLPNQSLLPPNGPPYTSLCAQTNSLSPFAVMTPVNHPPSANAGVNQIVEATSAAGASVTLSGSGSDPDGDPLTFAWSGPCGSSAAASATFTCPLGISIMTLTVSDGRGGSASSSVQITVQDTTPPALALPANITALAASSAGAAVNYSASASDIVSGSVPVSCAPASGSTFPIAITTVSCSASDAAGNSSSGSFTVTVSVGTPRISAAVAAKGRDASGNFYLDVRLTNTGTGHARNVRITSVTLRTLSGTGTVTYNAALSGALPMAAGNLDVGAAATVRLYLSVPATVTRFSVTEGGTLQNVAGASTSFSLGQSVIP